MTVGVKSAERQRFVKLLHAIADRRKARVARKKMPVVSPVEPVDAHKTSRRGRGLRLLLSPADELERQLKEAQITGYLREQTLVPGRRFRADFCWLSSRTMLVVEVDGGTFSRQGGKRCPTCGETPKGRHATGTGRDRDCEKQNLTVLQGYRYLVVTTTQVRDGRALAWIKCALTPGEQETK